MSIEDALTTYRGDLLASAERWQKGRERRRRRLVLATSALATAGMIVGTAIAGTGWLTGSPAPPSVKSDFGSYATQLGFTPEPGRAVLVASDGDFQLFATENEQGGLCTLVSTPWNRPSANGEGGDCVSTTPDATPFWAGTDGVSAEANGGSTVVVIGHTTDKDAASVQFETPNGAVVTAPVGSSGFFIRGTTLSGSFCDWGRWAPRFTVLDSSGNPLSSTTVTVFPGQRKITFSDGAYVCVAKSNGPYGSSKGRLP